MSEPLHLFGRLLAGLVGTVIGALIGLLLVLALGTDWVWVTIVASSLMGALVGFVWPGSVRFVLEVFGLTVSS